MMRRTTVAAATIIAIVIAALPAAPAAAATAPSWADVLRARGDEAAASRQAEQIAALVTELEDKTATAKAAADTRGRELQVAQEAADAAAGRFDTLTTQADEARADAAGAEEQIASWSAYLSRSAGRDLTVSITADTDDLLSRLGTASKVTDTMNTALRDAATKAGTATALSKQAKAAKRKRDQLRNTAAAAFTAASTAAADAAAAEATQRSRQRELTDQLAVLRNRTLSTEAAYTEAERRRAAAARAAAAAAAAQAAQNRPQTPSNPGAVSAAGWTMPIASYSSYQAYGNRLHPVLGYYRLHAGDDFGAACGTGLYAASAGTVTYAGPYGGYGNLITIDHGGGVTTNYAHMFPAGVQVTVGQRVNAGQKIAEVGNAGLSTGCHLHFEVRQSGTAIPPTPFLNGKGA